MENMTKKRTISLQVAIDFGEYDPEYLSSFPEWHTLTVHIQWELIRKALDNRHHQLMTHYAELNNVLDLRNKPNVQEAIKRMEKQLRSLADDKERLYIEYSKKI